MIRERICSSRELTEVPVDPGAELATEGGIVGRDAIVRNARSCVEILEACQSPMVFTLGGTCGIELGPVSHLNRVHGGQMAVVWLDAHGDLNTPATSPSGHFHGMSLRTLLGEGDPEIVSLSQPSLLPEQVFLVGVRDLDPAEQEYVASSGLSVFDVHTTGHHLAAQIRSAGFRRVYVHLDLDVLEPGDFDEVIYPVSDGMRYERLLDILGALTELTTVVGSSLLEFVPGENPQLEKLREIAQVLES